MIHARKDYMRFQDPAIDNPELFPDVTTPIASDEPVMLFRAKDHHFLMVLAGYWNLLNDEGNHEMAAMVKRHMEEARIWQVANGVKRPDVPKEQTP